MYKNAALKIRLSLFSVMICTATFAQAQMVTGWPFWPFPVTIPTAGPVVNPPDGSSSGGTTTTATDLPTLSIDSTRITVSGLSGGAFMSAQLLMAASDILSGAGVVAGGIPGCPQQGGSNTAQTTCMSSPNQESITDLLTQYKTLASNGDVPPLANLKTKLLYVYDGTQDTTVNPASGQKLQQWAEQLMPSSSITTEFSIASAHGFPTLTAGNSCGLGESPWINSCSYDGAGAILQSLHQAPNPKGTAVSANLTSFDQTSYADDNSSMVATGYIYVPAVCATKACGLHIALHGCAQSPDYVQTQFVSEAGYNDWAESNDLIVLYPSVKSGSGNPYGCWDWWGYSGTNYLARSAPQIDSLLKMIAHFTGSTSVGTKGQ